MPNRKKRNPDFPELNQDDSIPIAFRAVKDWMVIYLIIKNK